MIMLLIAFLPVILLVGMFIFLALKVFVEYTKLDELESYFSENKLVQANKRFWGRNLPIDKYMRMSLIINFLSCPRQYVKKGDVTEAELASVPPGLKRWAVWPYHFGMIWFVGAGIWYFWTK